MARTVVIRFKCAITRYNNKSHYLFAEQQLNRAKIRPRNMLGIKRVIIVPQPQVTFW